MASFSVIEHLNIVEHIGSIGLSRLEGNIGFFESTPATFNPTPFDPRQSGIGGLSSKMGGKAIRHVPVVDRGTLLGIVRVGQMLKIRG